MLTAKRVIELLHLEPLPVEGGYFCETYRAAETLDSQALPERYDSSRPFGTAIYYFLHGEHFSAFHRLRTDEVYHFYLGQAVELVLLSPDGTATTRWLGSDLEAGQRPQATVPRGVWQALRLAHPGPESFALLGTTMAPGFDPADFELGDQQQLLISHPHQAKEITALTRP